MPISIDKRYKYKTFQAGDYQLAVQNVCNHFGIIPQNVNIKARFTYAEGVGELKKLSIPELGTVMSLKSHIEHTEISCELPDNSVIFIFNNYEDNYLSFYISSDDAVHVRDAFNIFTTTLKLEEFSNSSTTIASSYSTQNKHGSHQIADDTDLTPTKVRGEVSCPDKITLAWLARHSPISFWIWFVGIIVTAFVSGLKMGQLEFVRQLLLK